MGNITPRNSMYPLKSSYFLFWSHPNDKPDNLHRETGALKVVSFSWQVSLNSMDQGRQGIPTPHGDELEMPSKALS
jgi:hypothetical protein